MTRILICGSRNQTSFEKNKNTLLEYPQYTETKLYMVNVKVLIIQDDIAKKLNMTVLEFSAEQKKYGLKAGPMRNQQMLVERKPDICYAFHESIGTSK